MAYQALIPLASAAISAFSNNWNVNKSLHAQSKENAANRSYNAVLANQQNAWNRAQWMQELQYNSPSAQLGRLRAAGLNPDMVYGHGILNTAAASPQMTAGAPSQSMDWSPLANKKTLGNVLSDSLNMDMARAQIESVKANTKKTLADAGLSEISLEYADAEKRLGLKLTEQQYEKVKQDYEIGIQAIEKNIAELESISLENAYKAIRNAFESEVFQTQINILAEELHIKKAEAAHAYMYYAAQLLGMQADNKWKDAAWIIQQKDGVPTLIKYGSEVLQGLLGNIGSFIGKGKKPKGSSITINNNIPKPKS